MSEFGARCVQIGKIIIFHTQKCYFRPMFKLNILLSKFFYSPQRSWDKVIFSEACVKNSVHRGEGSTPLYAGIHPPEKRQAPPPGTRGRHHPPPGPEAGTHTVQSMLGDTGNKWVVRIILECNLVLLIK